MTLSKKLSTVGTVLAVTAFIHCLANSGAVAESSRRYLALCGNRVIPCLFVFSVLGALVSGGEGFIKLCSAIPRFGTELAVLGLGLCGGVPLGPVTALELYKRGSIGKRQAEYLCTFSATPSLSFIVSYTSAAFGDATVGYKLALLTVAASLITAVVFRYIMLSDGERAICLSATSARKPFSRILSDSATSTVIICACVVFFGSLSELMPFGLGMLMELSVGISLCGTVSTAGFLLGFSGISILCQVAAACKGELNVYPCVAAKLLQGVIMGVGAKLFID